MANPWLKKNPFMSLWLSAANAAAGAARGQATGAAKRASSAAMAQAGNQMLSFWTAALAGPPKKRARRKARR